MQKLRDWGNLKHFFRNELKNLWFAHDAAYSDSEDLARRTVSDKTLKDRAFEIFGNSEYNGYQRGFASMVYKLFDDKAGLGVSLNGELV